MKELEQEDGRDQLEVLKSIDKNLQRLYDIVWLVVAVTVVSGIIVACMVFR